MTAQPAIRRRRTLGALTTLLAAAALAACGSSGSTTGGTLIPPASGGSGQLLGKVHPTPADPGALTPVANAEQAFSLSLLHAVGGTGATNVSTSPSSLETLLAMLYDGARGTTKSQIAATLHLGTASSRLDAGWHQQTQRWTSTKDTTLSTANALWVQKHYAVLQPYLDDLRTYYDSGIWQADFENDNAGALKAIDAWTAQHTDGKITKLFDSLDPTTELVLADAVYFKAGWQTTFDPRDTEDGQFTLASGTQAKASFMHLDNLDARSAITPAYDAVQLPYTGGRFAALVVMPKTGSVADLTASLARAGGLASIDKALTEQQVMLSLPKFTTTSSTDLDAPLQHLGMPAAFTDGADFGAMSSKPLKVGTVQQRVYLSVGEKGTEAAAATGAGIVAGAVPGARTEITIDHPFLFLVRDTTTGAVLFASQIADPAAS